MQAQLAASNPFAVLTAIVAPAILTNACSVLALGASNRLARVVDRTRVVTADIVASKRDSPEYHGWTSQLHDLDKRGIPARPINSRGQPRPKSRVCVPL